MIRPPLLPHTHIHLRTDALIIWEIFMPSIFAFSDEGQTATSTSTSHNLNNNDNLNNHKNDNKNNNSGISVTGVSTNRMTTRSQASKTSSKCTQYMISCSPNGDRQAKTDANLFADTFVSQQAKSDSNANTLDVVSGDKKPDSVAKPFHKRGE